MSDRCRLRKMTDAPYKFAQADIDHNGGGYLWARIYVGGVPNYEVSATVTIANGNELILEAIWKHNDRGPLEVLFSGPEKIGDLPANVSRVLRCEVSATSVDLYFNGLLVKTTAPPSTQITVGGSVLAYDLHLTNLTFGGN